LPISLGSTNEGKSHLPIRETENNHCLLTSFSSEQKTVDQKELETYWAGIKGTMKGHPIEVLAAYGKHEVLEGDPIEGIVIAKFPTVKAAKDWYCGEAYQSVAKHRQKGAIYQGLIVEGVI
jgi:uncharacterized protein (DUF1330 family)